MPSEESSGLPELPPTLPVMVLEGCSLFPHGILPLYIFEPRYREMLVSALDSHRIFCIGTVDESGDPGPGVPDRPVYPCSTAGLIRACVGNEDGSSNLILQGIGRIRFTGWENDQSYAVATIEKIKTLPIDDPKKEKQQVAKVRDLVADLAGSGMPINEKLRESIEQVKCPEIMADLVAYNFIRSIPARQSLLEMESLAARFEFIIETLERMRKLIVE